MHASLPIRRHTSPTCGVPTDSPILPDTHAPIPSRSMTFPETAKLVFFAKKAHGGKKKRPGPEAVLGETKHFDLGRAGRLAPCWLTDFISGDLSDETDYASDTPNDILHVGCATAEFRRDLARKNGTHCPDNVTPPIVRHELLLKGHQSLQDDKEKTSTQPPRRADGNECDEVLACVCQNCRYHFTIYIDRGDKDHLCGTSRGNKEDPFHHLVQVYTNKIAPKSINTKFYPYHALAQFNCSAARCDFKISVEISSPRLSQRFLGFLTDNDSIRNRLKRAVEEEPERFADVANVTPNALAYLRAYLRDIVDEKREKNPDGSEVERKIDQRNKKFYIQFGNGPEAAELFTYLGFEEKVVDDNRSWKVPNPPVTRPTRPGSQLAFYQDVKSEVETIMGKDSQNMKPNAAISFITNALDIGVFYTTDLKESDIMERYQMSDYACLGLAPSLHDMYFWYAYTCQRQTKPSDEPKFFESLERLAIGRNNEELEIRVQSAASMRTMQPQNREAASMEEDEIRRATEMSLEDYEQPQAAQSIDRLVTQAYNYFGLQEGQRSDDEVLGKFVANCEAIPSQKNSYREKLLLIARHTNSSNLEKIATEDMTTEEAYDYLGVSSDTHTDFITSLAQYHDNSQDKDYALIIAALYQISKARGGESVLVTAAQGIMSEHNKLRNLPVPGFDQMDLDFSSRPQVVNMSLPVGLENIRNTCYLNSILQYFYTVKPIHMILEHIGELGLPDTEASLQNRRIDPGSTHLEKGEAYAGRQFVEQISSLYQDMRVSQESSLRPQQRLAIAALKNSASLIADGKKLLKMDQGGDGDHSVAFNLTGSSRAGTPAPPLPFRHSPASSLAAAAQNTTIHVNSPAPLRASSATQASETENADSSSLRSSQTLVMDEGRIGDQLDGSRQHASQMSVSMAEVQEDDDDDAVHDAPLVTHVEEAGDQGAPPSYEAAMGGMFGDNTMTSVPPAVQTVFDPPPQPELTVEEMIDRALNDSSVTGTDQQDVEEVMGNIISHLRAAVRDTGIDEATGAQRDPITDTFFWTSATYSRSDRHGAYNRQVAPNRWVTAYPEEKRKTHLLQALNNNFLREFITQDTWYERFTSIVNLPPILHIHIQRGKGDGTKNKSPVAIPEVLHLDQFMDCQEGTDLFARRRHAWNIHERIRSLKGPNSEAPDITFATGAVGKATHYTNLVADEYLKRYAVADNNSAASLEDKVIFDDFDQVENDDIDDGYVLIDSELQEIMDVADVSSEDVSEEIGKATEATDLGIDKFCTSKAMESLLDAAHRPSPDEIQQIWLRQDLAEASNAMMRSPQEKVQEYEQELQELFEDLQDPKYAYRLHAVVCHSGNTGTAGHYWVWVYDFERQLWRKYNDSIVLEERDSAKVINELSNQGEPYYLAYVRVADVADYVGVPLREDHSTQEAQEAELFPLGVPPPPPRPHHASILKRIPEEDSSDSSSPKSTPLTDDVSTSNLSPVPPTTHLKSQPLTTPPREADEAEQPAIGGNDGQVDVGALVSRPIPPPPPRPAQNQETADDGEMQ